MAKRFIFIGSLAFVALVGIFAQNYFTKNNSENSTTVVNVANHTVNNDDNLTKTVRKICQSVEKNDINSLKDLVIEVPDIYTQKNRESMRKYLKMDEKTFKELTREPKAGYNVSLYPVSSSKEELVYNAIPSIKSIQEQKRKFIKIIDLKQFENEAKATVSFGSNELSEVNYEILLIKDGGDWKTFRFTYPDRWADTYAEGFQE